MTVPRKKIIVLDTETTGLFYQGNPPDEMLQLAMVDGDGNVLFNELFKPENRQRWDRAQQVNNISPYMVRDKKPFKDFHAQVQEIVDCHDLIVAYNVRFDIGFLRSAGISFAGKEFFDVMEEHTARHGAFRSNGRRSHVSLEKCAAFHGYDFTDAHEALADTRATLYCYEKLLLR